MQVLLGQGDDLGISASAEGLEPVQRLQMFSLGHVLVILLKTLLLLIVSESVYREKGEETRQLNSI